jgi:hypothetical protein
MLEEIILLGSINEREDPGLEIFANWEVESVVHPKTKK